MSIKLELYRVFKEVADEGSVSAAAKNLYISQSAVSQTIKQLEGQLGVRLFIRGTRGVTLTNEGKTLYTYVHSAISLIENGENKIAQTKNLELGELVIAASDTITSRYLMKYLKTFHGQYPKIRLRVMNGTSSEVISMLKVGKADIAFVNNPVEEDSVCVHSCLETHDVFAAAPNFDIDFEAEYTPAQIAHYPLILLEKRTNSRRYVDGSFIQNGAVATPEIELGSHDLLLELAKIGLGVTCVVREFSEEQLSSGELRELKVVPPIPQRYVALCSLKNVTPSAACAKFLELIGCMSQEKKIAAQQLFFNESGFCPGT